MKLFVGQLKIFSNFLIFWSKTICKSNQIKNYFYPVPGQYNFNPVFQKENAEYNVVQTFSYASLHVSSISEQIYNQNNKIRNYNVKIISFIICKFCRRHVRNSFQNFSDIDHF